MTKYQIKSDLSEHQIELDVSRFLGWISPVGNSPFQLFDVDENITGADVYFNKVFPLYIQFKTSQGLLPVSAISPSNRKNRSKLEDIRIFRDELELDDDPTLYFQLRKRAANAEDFQHNILMNYSNTGFSQAFYVAPLTLSKIQYSQSLFSSANRFTHFPFVNKNYKIFQEKWISYFGFVPFLRDHVSIIPHERINTYKHYYSFSKNGTDIAWHSSKFLDEGPTRFSDLLTEIILKKLDYKSEVVNFEQLAEKLKYQYIFKKYFKKIRYLKPLDVIVEHGRILKDKYNIRQILLVIKSKNR